MSEITSLSNNALTVRIEATRRHLETFRTLGKTEAAERKAAELADLLVEREDRVAAFGAKAAQAPTAPVAPVTTEHQLYDTGTSTHYLGRDFDGNPVRGCNGLPTNNGRVITTVNGYPTCHRCTGAHLPGTHLGR